MTIFLVEYPGLESEDGSDRGTGWQGLIEDWQIFNHPFYFPNGNFKFS